MSDDEPLLCGIDAGSSQVRALVFDRRGKLVAGAAEPTPTRILGPDRAETHAADLWRAVAGVLRRALGALPEPRAVRSVAVASVGESGVLLGGDGRVLAPIIAWYDTRTREELDQLLDTVGFERLHRLTGLCADPTFTLLKLLWYRRRQPELLAAATAWLNIGDYLAWRLCGERATDLSLASRTLLLDLEGRRWSAELRDAAGLPAGLLSPICPAGSRIGAILPEVARETGLPPDCIVGVGGHDHVCGMFAVGADRPGVLLDSIGTAEALSLVRDRPASDPIVGRDGFQQGAFDAGRPLYYMFGGLPTAAAAVEWFRGQCGGVGHAALIAEAEAADPVEQVMFLPHLRLGSPPFPDPVGRGAFLGIASTTGRGALFRAVLEGIALDGGNMLETMLRHAGGGAPERILVIGGSTKNRLLMRLKASVYGARLGVVEFADATCLGAALLGGLAAGVFADLDEARSAVQVPIGSAEPDPHWTPGHRARRQAAYAAAYAALRPVHARLLDG